MPSPTYRTGSRCSDRRVHEARGDEGLRWGFLR